MNGENRSDDGARERLLTRTARLASIAIRPRLIEDIRPARLIISMKTKFLNWIAVATVAFAGACSKNETTTSQTEKGTDSSKKIEVEYSYNEKPRFVAKLKEELAEVNDELKRMGEKIAGSTDKPAEEAKPKFEQLKEKAKNLDVHIDKVENSTESTWEDVKAGSKKALEDVKSGFNEARAWAAEKIAPK